MKWFQNYFIQITIVMTLSFSACALFLMYDNYQEQIEHIKCKEDLKHAYYYKHKLGEFNSQLMHDMDKTMAETRKLLEGLIEKGVVDKEETDKWIREHLTVELLLHPIGSYERHGLP